MIRYGFDDGLALVQTDTLGQSKRQIPLTAEDLDEIVRVWPRFRTELESANALNAVPETRSPTGSRASQGQGNSPSSSQEEKLL